MKHQLGLLENATDSLAEALRKFEEGEEGDHKSYKFAVLHMSHFMELIFKHHIHQRHHLLIYKNPFAVNVDKNQTITLWDAVNFIANEREGAITKEFRSDLGWLKKLRNDIEHHKFEMDVPEVRNTIGRLFRALLEFNEGEDEVNLRNHIPQSMWDTFKLLSDEHEFRLRDALTKAERIEGENAPDYGSGEYGAIRVQCDECGYLTMVVDKDSPTGFRCTFCGAEDGDSVPAYCDMCGAEATREEMDYWHDDETGQVETRCYFCSGRYAMDKDD
jgi:hypothetical protein